MVTSSIQLGVWSMSKDKIRRLDISSGLFLLFFAIFIAIESCRLGLGEWNNPGAGYFAFGGALILGIMSLSVLLKGFRNRSEKEISLPDSEPLNWRNVFFVLAGMIIYSFIFDKIGFILSTFLLIVFFLRVIAPQRWAVTILIAFFCALGSYLLFDVLLSAELPKGILGF